MAKLEIIRMDWLPSFFFLIFLSFGFYERQLTPNYATPIFDGYSATREKFPSWATPGRKIQILMIGRDGKRAKI